jgi:hypothetical protein
VIHDIIRNPVYKGKRRWNNDEVPVPPIISDELWQDVNDNLVDNKKKVGKREEYHYLLNGLIFCEDCKSEFRGKKRLKGSDNAYKCKGKSRHGINCNSRGISLPKFETFIIKHLFKSKDLQEFLSGLAENKSQTDNFLAKLNKEKSDLAKNKIIEKRAYDLLFDPDFKDDTTVKDRLMLVKKKIREQEVSITFLENKLIERDKTNRKKRIQNIIGEYKLTSGFDETKKLIHSLIKKITIKHVIREDTKTGNFIIQIEYKGFDESSIFITDWQALKWYWMSHFRSQAITKEDMDEDTELLKYFIKASGKRIKIPSDFIGFKVGSVESEIIELDKKELINFD